MYAVLYDAVKETISVSILKEKDMKKGRLKIALFSLFILMVFSISSSVYAETLQPGSSITYALAGWNGAYAQDGNKRVLLTRCPPLAAPFRRP